MKIQPGSGKSRTVTFFLFWVPVVIAATVIGLTSLGGCAPSGDPPPDGSPALRGIVLITVDGLIAEDLSIWGGPVKSAGLEQLAAGGHTWRDVWTPSPMTRPAAASYLTGRSPDRHGVVDDVFASLPEGTPTLATQLGGLGFRTAAFPDSSFVGPPSGLLRDFEVWDAPPRPNLGGSRWIPAVKSPSVQVDAFRSWTASLGVDERFFGWVHITRPVLAQLADGETGPPPAILEDFVAVIDGVLEAASGPGVAVAVVGTFGDVGGGVDGLAGIGYSLEERAVRVPLIARFPGGLPGARPAGATVWGLDLSATLARLGGTSLPEGEGIDLSVPRNGEAMFTFSWATLDQMGWKAQRAVRLGQAKRIEGLRAVTRNVDDRAAEVDAVRSSLLEQAMARRAEPPRALVPLEAVRELMDANGLKPNAHPTTGRDFASHQERAAVTRATWKCRRSALRNDLSAMMTGLDAVLQLDPDNLGALLDRGQLTLQGGRPERAAPLLRRVVELYPGNPETLHWWAHSLWADNWKEGEKILKAALPYMPHDRDVLYDLACAGSLAEALEASENYLRSAIEAGFDEWEYMEVDVDLRNLRESGRFARLMQEYRR